MEATAISIKPAELNLNPLTQIDPVVIVAVAIIVIVTYLLLKRFYVQPYLEVMEAREGLFDTAREQSAEAKSVTQDSELRAEAAVAEAVAASEDLRTAAKARADAYRKEQVAAASLQASELLEKGRADLRTAREAELASVQTQAVECVTAACVQLVGDVDAETAESTVVRLMERKAR
ncbi:MAG: hypothetical protein WCJ13_09680 [Coriobacteriia bacterium]